MTVRAGKRRRVAAGSIVIWEGGSLLIGRVEEAVGAHAHHAIQITLAVQGAVRLRARGTNTWTSSAGALVASRTPHEMDARGAIVALIFVEPESLQGRMLAERHATAGIAPLPRDRVEAAVAALSSWHARDGKSRLVGLGRAIVADLAAGMQPRRNLDPRVARALIYLRSSLERSVTLADAAAAVALSPGRFRHLFVAETGLTFRAYLLWLRLGRAVELVAAGRAITEAAHAAGFADAAHLSRTFRRHFGIAPATLDPG
jgi:AraC-like DNA-binding protein